MLTSTMTSIQRLRRILRRVATTIVAAVGLSAALPAAAALLNLSQVPLFLTDGQAPLVLLTMARDHKLYYEAYNDYSDLNGDGVLDIGYKPSLDYYGYFDSYKCYVYSGVLGRYVPSNVTADKKCNNKWSGDFLNYVTTARIDALRKVLYGGSRKAADTAGLTVLERTYIPQDAHSWGKEYQSVARDGYDIGDYTPFDVPVPGYYHLFANVTLDSPNNAPLMRVLTNSRFRVWQWLSIERPVASTQCNNDLNVKVDCDVNLLESGPQWQGVPASAFSGLVQSIYSTNGNGTAAINNNGAFNSLVNTYATPANFCGSRPVSQIDGNDNPFPFAPCLTNGDRYLNLMYGTINIPETGTYRFAVDGDDAVDVFFDGNATGTGSGPGDRVADYYGTHGMSNGTSREGSKYLTAGQHKILFRHQNGDGGEGWKLYWRRTVPVSPMTDYIVRVEVCNASVGLEANCDTYGTSKKPVGLLQRQGGNDGMYFGLMTGTYAHNTQGGAMRKAVSSIKNEITADGRFGGTSEICQSGTNCVNGIISTINRLRITGFNGSEYDCGFITDRQMADGQCAMWGNPIGEMVYEGMRYFAGETTPTAGFMYGAGANVGDETLGLPVLRAWENPYAASRAAPSTTPVFASCSKPYTMLISDVYPSFDSDSIPGTAFGTYATSDRLSNLAVAALGQIIWNNELGAGAKNVFIGQSGLGSDGLPTAKSASSFGNIRGLAPGEPTREGSYYSAAAAYHGHINDLNAAAGDQKLSTYAVALAAPLPKLDIPVNGRTVTIMPFGKSVGGSGISAAANAFQPTNQIVDFYVDTIRNVVGSPTDASINEGRPYYKFRINYEDVEQGADHDMDAIAIYEIKLNANNTVSVAVTSEYAAGSIIQHMGFAISGTSADNAYLLVRDTDTAAGGDPVYRLDCRTATTDPARCFDAGNRTGSPSLPLYKELIFTPSTSASASQLKDPLWYAAKWGGFSDDNGNNLPDGRDGVEWDGDGDGDPDNYFLVTNPLMLEQQLTKAFAKIKSESATAAATSANSYTIQTDSALYLARFSSDGWTGELGAFPIRRSGELGSPLWRAESKLAGVSGNARTILTANPDADAGTRGMAFRWAGMPLLGAMRASLQKNFNNVIDLKGADRVTYLRGDAVADMRNRPFIAGTTTINKLGDIVSSQPQYVSFPSAGLPETSYDAFKTANLNRAPMIYVGANDGMMHAFSAADGAEKMAFIPSEMYRVRNGQPLLSKLTASNYGQSVNAHNYYVDGSVTVGDACKVNCAAAADWRTLAIGGLGGGGQGIYALDVTNPNNFSEANAASLVLWEFTDQDDTDTDAAMRNGLGYTYSRPQLVRVCTARTAASQTVPKTCTAGRWVVIFGNGYNNSEADGAASSSGHAILYVLDALTGRVLKKINTKAGTPGTPNGLATVAVIDIDSDDYADSVYAGDLLGNVWKFDISSDTIANWASAFSGPTAATPLPFYTARTGAGVAQKITTAPDARRNPAGGLQVVFGTGSYIAVEDKADVSQNTMYGIRDSSAIVPSANRSNLQQQTVNTVSATLNSREYRTVSNNVVPATAKGWYMNLPESGERVAYDPRISGSVLAFTTTIPTGDLCGFGGTGWDYYTDAITGGRLDYSIFNNLGILNYGSSSGYASAEKSVVGVSAPGTVLGVEGGISVVIKNGSAGASATELSPPPGSRGRVSWREIVTD